MTMDQLRGDSTHEHGEEEYCDTLFAKSYANLQGNHPALPDNESIQIKTENNEEITHETNAHDVTKVMKIEAFIDRRTCAEDSSFISNNRDSTNLQGDTDANSCSSGTACSGSKKLKVTHSALEITYMCIKHDCNCTDAEDGNGIEDTNRSNFGTVRAPSKAYKVKKKEANRHEKLFICDFCEYSTTKKGNLKVHKLRHAGDKPYKCDLCDYAARQLAHLQNHKLIHTGDKPYKCDLCDYATTHSGNLKVHKRTHVGEKPHKCDLCDYSATQRLSLEAHKSKHICEKPFKCNKLDYTARQLKHLQNHKLIHTGDKPYLTSVIYVTTALHSVYLSKHTSRNILVKGRSSVICVTILLDGLSISKITS